MAKSCPRSCWMPPYWNTKAALIFTVKLYPIIMNYIVHLISAQTIQKGIECVKLNCNYELTVLIYILLPKVYSRKRQFQSCHQRKSIAYLTNYKIWKSNVWKEARLKVCVLSICTLQQKTESKDSRAVLYFKIYDIHLLSTSKGLTSKKIMWKIACVQKSFHDS